MPQVDICINGRIYKLACEEGEEAHLHELAAFLDRQVEDIQNSFGKVGDSRLLVIAGLTITDRLSEAMTRIEQLQTELEAARQAQVAAMEKADSNERKLAGKLEAAARRLEDISRQFNGSA